MRACALLALAGLCACGASSAEVEKSKNVAYNADFTEVWKAAFEEVSGRYDGQIVKANPDDGLILSNWKIVEAQRDPSLGTSRTPAAETVLTLGGTYFRHIVYVSGKDGEPPWYVQVDGEAASYTPGAAVLTPFPHGSADEPHWVPGRIDDLRASIYKRLAKYAVEAPPPSDSMKGSISPSSVPLPPPKVGK